MNNLSDENLIAKEELSKHSIKKYEFKSIADFPLEKPPEKEESNQNSAPPPPPKPPTPPTPPKKQLFSCLLPKTQEHSRPPSQLQMQF
ncbi:FliH/SctL family protein [Helicobacter bizzozeronii]|uniref:hypothetical protein n=1 Tax=Helicobacter bizzozeronii TaxID=56877 RepID=UPI000CEF4D8A|nr:hypothetical protein [Helicobacter bizzozeronii]